MSASMTDEASTSPANPFSTGAGGSHFENKVQSAFLATTVANAFIPCLPNARAQKVYLQGGHLGYLRLGLLHTREAERSDRMLITKA